MEKKTKILIVCGEASGDHHAASLVKAIRELEPAAEFFGAGGPELEAEGVELVYDLTSVAVVGFFEVIKHLGTFRKVFRRLLEEAKARKPDAAVLLDYPGFNLALARELRKLGIPVIYYISPQVWAWGKERVRQIRRDVDKMLVILPFEKDFYASEGVDVEFVGHPALDSVRPSVSRAGFLATAGLDEKKLTLALLPGSREKEVRSLLPVMLSACRICAGYMPPGSLQFVILRSPSVPAEVFEQVLAGFRDLPAALVSGRAYDGVSASDFCLVCSGTATLETGILGTPMAVLYKVHPLTWMYIRLMIKIPFIGLVNIVKGKKVAEELIQFDCVPEKIADAALSALKYPEVLSRMRGELASIKEILGKPGASGRAAEQIVDFLRNKR